MEAVLPKGSRSWGEDIISVTVTGRPSIYLRGASVNRDIVAASPLTCPNRLAIVRRGNTATFTTPPTHQHPPLQELTTAFSTLPHKVTIVNGFYWSWLFVNFTLCVLILVPVQGQKHDSATKSQIITRYIYVKMLLCKIYWL